jgi:hypothetical protein
MRCLHVKCSKHLLCRLLLDLPRAVPRSIALQLLILWLCKTLFPSQGFPCLLGMAWTSETCTQHARAHALRILASTAILQQVSV